MLTEKQKMLAGELYLATDPELVAARLRARRLLRRYGRCEPDDAVGRRRILEELLGSIGERIDIEPPFYCDYGSQIIAGDGLYMNFNCVVLDCNVVRFGKNVFCAPGVQIYTAHHPLDAAQRVAGPELASPITIGDRVWIGGGAIICPGVTIGEDTVIGAGSVVVRDIPARVLAVGNPCRVVRALG
jgi:maltose O-acetyltransferase